MEEFFLAELPQPPFYPDGNSIGAVTWFKTATADDLIAGLAPLRDLLDRYDVEHGPRRGERSYPP